MHLFLKGISATYIFAITLLLFLIGRYTKENNNNNLTYK